MARLPGASCGRRPLWHRHPLWQPRSVCSLAIVTSLSVVSRHVESRTGERHPRPCTARIALRERRKCPNPIRIDVRCCRMLLGYHDVGLAEHRGRGSRAAELCVRSRRQLHGHGGDVIPPPRSYPYQNTKYPIFVQCHTPDGRSDIVVNLQVPRPSLSRQAGAHRPVHWQLDQVTETRRHRSCQQSGGLQRPANVSSIARLSNPLYWTACISRVATGSMLSYCCRCLAHCLTANAGSAVSRKLVGGWLQQVRTAATGFCATAASACG